MKSTGAESVRSEVLELDSRACSSKSAISFPTIGPFHDDTIPLASSTSEPVPRSSTSNNNVDLSPPTVLTGRQKLIRLCIVGSTLATVVLVQMLYVWGTIFDLGTRISNLAVVVVDYDEGLIGTATQQALVEMTGPKFPTMVLQPRSEYSDPEDLLLAVRHRKYWGAFWATHNASSRFWTAMGNSTQIVAYSTGEPALGYAWNAVYFANFVEPIVGQHLVRVAALTARIVTRRAVDHLTSSANGTILTAQKLEVLADPCPANITTLDAKRVAGSAAFIHLAIAGIAFPSQIFIGVLAFLTGKELWLRFVPAVLFPCTTSMMVVGSTWILKGHTGSDLRARDFFLTFLVLWSTAIALYVNYLAIRVVLGGDPHPMARPSKRIMAASFVWTVTNMVSVIAPAQLSPRFYTWATVLPGHAMYSLISHVWVRNPVSTMWPDMVKMALWVAMGTCLVTGSHLIRNHSRNKEHGSPEIS